MKQIDTISGSSDLLDKVKSEYSLGSDQVRGRRGDFEERLYMYNNQKKDKDAVGIMNIYTAINTLLSIYYTDEVTVDFVARKYGYSDQEENLRKLSVFDQQEMDLPVKNYFNQWDRLFYGVGIRVFGDYNRTTNTPTIRTVSPHVWVPDPRGTIDEGFSFHGFELLVNKDELTKDAGYNMDAVRKLKTDVHDDNEAENMRKAYQEAQGLNSISVDRRKTMYAPIYHHYTSYKGKKYLVTTGNDHNVVLRIVELPAITEAEKDDPRLIPFPVVLNYLSPVRYSPFGTSICDMVEDKQRVNSVLINLAVKKEKASLYPMALYNPRMVKNRRDFDFAMNKYIPVNVKQGESLSNAVQLLEKDLNKSTTGAIKELLDAESRLTTGADAMQAGVLSPNVRTLGEVQQVQANANLRFLLGSRVNAWGEVQFWKYWYREYKGNWNNSSKKIIRATFGGTYNYQELGKKDIITKEDPDIIVRSRLESDKKKERESLRLQQQLPLVMPNPNIPLTSKMEMLRDLFKKSGYTKEEVLAMVPKTPDELNAEQENLILSQKDAEPVAVRVDDDDSSHIIIHMRAENTINTQTHKQAHINASIRKQRQQAQQMQQMQAQGQGQGYDKQMASQGQQSQNQTSQRLAQMAGQDISEVPTQ